MADEFLRAAIEEAERGARDGGIPIGSVVVHESRILGRGHNQRVQRGSAVLHAGTGAPETAGRPAAAAAARAAEVDALEPAGRLPPRVYGECVLYTTLSPCAMCSGAILLYGI